MESLPAPVKAFVAVLAEKLPEVRPLLEPGGEKAGNWWIDLSGPKPITVEWRPGAGFGFSAEAGSYGEGPAEIFRDPERAVHRIAQLLDATQSVAPTRLRAIRELYGVTQKQIAARLKIQQAAISRLENRGDSKIETIGHFVQALGGHIEIRAVFPDGQMPIYTTRRKAKSGAASKARRAAP